jgi:molybdopterin molybdotransferase
MISPDEALEIVFDNVAPLGLERASIIDALGRVLGEQIYSPRDIPGFDNSAMDGYAVRAIDIQSASESSPVRLTVVETVGAGVMPSLPIGTGQAARTMTGAPIADGADAIVPVERTRGSEVEVEILASTEKGAFVRPRGEDLRRGELVISPGKALSASDLGMLASLNRSMVDVYRRPRVAIVATGDELVDVDTVPSGAQVINSSAYALASAIRETGGEPIMLKVARDRPEEVRARLAEALAFDVVLTTGGVSVGQFDHVKVVLDELGLRQLFHGVAQKPGRPLKFGTISGKPIFGLPGNPVSTMVCFYLYVRPALRRMTCRGDLGLPRITARCAMDIQKANNLTEFVRVTLSRRAGEIYATPTGNQSSGVLSSLSRAHGLLIGPAKERLLKAASQAAVLLLDAVVAADAEAYFEERLRSAN